MKVRGLLRRSEDYYVDWSEDYYEGQRIIMEARGFRYEGQRIITEVFRGLL